MEARATTFSIPPKYPPLRQFAQLTALKGGLIYHSKKVKIMIEKQNTEKQKEIVKIQSNLLEYDFIMKMFKQTHLEESPNQSFHSYNQAEKNFENKLRTQLKWPHRT